MTAIDRSALLPHSAAQIFDLVADIESYPGFLKGCVGAKVLTRSDTEVVAQLSLSRAGISHQFTTRNTMHPHERIELTLVDGPFEQFSGFWTFTALAPTASKVALSLNFRLRGGVAHMAAGRLFDKVALDLVDAVVKRAGVLYGKSSV